MVELIWDARYDADGRRIAPLPQKAPFQTIETINERAQQYQPASDHFNYGRPAEGRNSLIWSVFSARDACGWSSIAMPARHVESAPMANEEVILAN